MSKQLCCPICGEPTNVYMGKARKDGLCRKHGMQANKGELVKCTDCGKWNEKDVICECKKKEESKLESNDFTEQKENKCLLCDNDSGKFLFCRKF